MKNFNTCLNYEENIINEYLENHKHPDNVSILLICPDYNIDDMVNNIKQKSKSILNIDVISNKKNIFNSINNFFTGDVFDILNNINTYKTYDIIISTRTIEHFSLNNLLYFIYLINNISKDELILTYPDMDKIVEKIKENFKKYTLNKELELYNIELFNEGNHIYDYHKVYLNKEILENIATFEGYFVLKNESETNISIGSNRDVYIKTVLIKK